MNKNLKDAFLSRKFLMTVFALSALYGVYWKQVDYLYSFATYPPEAGGPLLTAFVNVTRDFMVAFTAAVLGYLGINGIVQWKHGTDSVVQQVSETLISKSSHEERMYNCEKLDPKDIDDGQVT